MSILLGILVGLALPVQTSVNNKLRDKVGTPYNSSLVSFIISTVFLACLLPTGMVSLGSVTMAAAYPLLTLGYCLLRGYAVQDLLICLVGSVIMAAMVIYMHRSNIQRIRDGKEYRFGRHGKQ